MRGSPGAGAISGTVDDSGSNALNDVEVEVFSTGSQNEETEVGSAYTQPNGTYSVVGLPSGTYDVCFDPFEATGGSSTTGYLGQCYDDVRLERTHLRRRHWSNDCAGRRGVEAAQSCGQAALGAAGRIPGTVDDTSSHALEGVSVSVIATSRIIEDESATTSSNGTYAVTGLTPGTYEVCFAALRSSEPTGGSSTSGYLDQCYDNVSWNGSTSAVPSGATSITVAAGATGGRGRALPARRRHFRHGRRRELTPALRWCGGRGLLDGRLLRRHLDDRLERCVLGARPHDGKLRRLLLHIDRRRADRRFIIYWLSRPVLRERELERRNRSERNNGGTGDHRLHHGRHQRCTRHRGRHFGHGR